VDPIATVSSEGPVPGSFIKTIGYIYVITSNCCYHYQSSDENFVIIKNSQSGMDLVLRTFILEYKNPVSQW
jgi:hypothetical protein